MRDYINSEIARRRAELAALEQRRLVLASELNLLEDLLEHAPPEETAQSRRNRAGRGAAKGRLSDRWMPVLIEAVRRYPGTIRGDEVPHIQSAAGQEPSGVNNIKTHFWVNSQPGKFYERVSSGEYRATEIGAQVAGIPLGGEQRESGNSNGADHRSAPLPDFENGDEPQSTATARFDPLNHNKAARPGGGT